jgi:hypothetical protein
MPSPVLGLGGEGGGKAVYPVGRTGVWTATDATTRSLSASTTLLTITDRFPPGWYYLRGDLSVNSGAALGVLYVAAEAPATAGNGTISRDTRNSPNRLSLVRGPFYYDGGPRIAILQWDRESGTAVFGSGNDPKHGRSLRVYGPFPTPLSVPRQTVYGLSLVPRQQHLARTDGLLAWEYAARTISTPTTIATWTGALPAGLYLIRGEYYVNNPSTGLGRVGLRLDGAQFGPGRDARYQGFAATQAGAYLDGGIHTIDIFFGREGGSTVFGLAGDPPLGPLHRSSRTPSHREEKLPSTCLATSQR